MPVFISHDMDDRAQYTALVAALADAGIAHWDPTSMRLGASLEGQLAEAIERCDSCVFLATANSVASTWCMAEVGSFWGAGKKVVALLADATIGTDRLPPQIRGDLAAASVAGLVASLRNQALRDAADHGRTLFFMSAASQDTEKRACIRNALQHADPPAPFADIATLADLDDDQLSDWHGLFLGMPYGQTFTPRLIARLVAWVRAGGRLVMCGFELGERHHGTNLNQLGGHFGITFNSDIVVRPPRDEEAESAYLGEMAYRKGYDNALRYQRFASGAALCEGVQHLAMANACSLHLEPGARPLVFASPNRVKELTLQSGRYSAPPQFKLAHGDQVFDPPYVDDRRAVAALAPPDLTLAGSVLALGSWDFRGGALAHDNARLLGNVRRWLNGRDQPPA